MSGYPYITLMGKQFKLVYRIITINLVMFLTYIYHRTINISKLKTIIFEKFKNQKLVVDTEVRKYTPTIFEQN